MLFSIPVYLLHAVVFSPVLFNSEQMGKSGQIEYLPHRLIGIADDHLAFAIHLLYRTEQDAKSRAGDVDKIAEIKDQLFCAADDLVDLFFKRWRCQSIESAFKKKRVFFPLVLYRDLKLGT